MTDTLQRMLDKEAIRDLLARYNHFHAAHRFEDIVGLFTAEATFDSIGGLLRGRAAMLEHFFRVIPDASAQLERKHYVTDILIDLDGDRAEVSSQLLFVRQSPEGLMVAAMGRYEDGVVRTPDGWRFARRKVLLDVRGDLGLAGH